MTLKRCVDLTCQHLQTSIVRRSKIGILTNSATNFSAEIERAVKLEGEGDSGYRQLVFLADGVLNTLQTVAVPLNSRRCFDSQ